MGVFEYAKNLAASIPQNNGFTMSPALLGAAGSVINGALGFFGQQSANKTNLKIARETNAANRANQEYQNEWNLDMWNKQNEYNSPSAQRQRLEAAGLNPIFNGLDGVSEAGQLQSADYVATAGAPMLNSGEFLGNGIGNAMKTMAEIKLLDAQAKKTDSERNLTDNELSVQKQLNAFRVTQAGLDIELTRSNITLTDENVKVATQNIENLKSQQALLDKEYDMVDKRFDLDRLRYDLDFWFKHESIALEKRSLDQHDKEIELERYKIIQDIAIAWYRSKTERASVRISFKNYKVNKRLADSTIEFNDGKIKMFGVQTDNIIQDTYLKGAQTFKAYREAYGGSGFVGNLLNLGAGILEFCTGRNPLDDKAYSHPINVYE